MPRDRTVRGEPSTPQPLARVVLRGAGVCALTALLVAAAGGGQVFWLCVPGALLLAASAADGRAAAAGALGCGLAGAAPALVSPTLGPPPSPLLAAAVLGASVAVLHAARRRLDADRVVLRTAALTDPLTGASNRRGLGERIEYEIARHARRDSSFTVLVLDLDGFKLVNDRFGHHAGDDLLCDVADALRAAVREQDTVARLGGDEFCVLAPETGADGATYLAERVAHAIAGVTTGLDTLSASVGVAVFPDAGREASHLLEAADDAEVAAKRRSRAARPRHARAA